MPTVQTRRLRALTTASLLPLLAIVAPSAAEAFQAGRSPDFTTCNIWFNDQGQPLRNKQGREIGQEVPCAGQVRHDVYKVFPGADNTLIIQDQTHQLECVLALVPGSTTIVAPKSCKAFRG